MILINGKESKLQTHQFANLEEMLSASYDDCAQSQEIITDVIVNDEHFSEIYPHQAEDISASQVDKLEIISVNMHSMANSVIDELFKVTKSMEIATIQSAEYFRKGDEAQGLELLQDLIDVNRDFLNIVGTLRSSFYLPDNQDLDATTATYSNLLTELIEVMESEDWVLLADLLEFEINPACTKWNSCLNLLKLHFSTDEMSTVSQ